MTTGVESAETAQRVEVTEDLGRQAAPFLEPLVGAGLVSVDSGGLITAWTAQAERAFGWRRGEVIGHPLVATVATPQERQRHERDLERVLSGEAAASECSFEIHARHRDGEEFTAQLALVPVPLGRGYEFSDFLEDVGSREWTVEEVGRLHARHQSVVEAALEAFTGDSRREEQGEGHRAAGALVLFRSEVGGRRSEERAAPEPEPDLGLPPEPAPEPEPAAAPAVPAAAPDAAYSGPAWRRIEPESDEA
jgi:PAS domain S-box-containing protein